MLFIDECEGLYQNMLLKIRNYKINAHIDQLLKLRRTGYPKVGTLTTPMVLILIAWLALLRGYRPCLLVFAEGNLFREEQKEK